MKNVKNGEVVSNGNTNDAEINIISPFAQPGPQEAICRCVTGGPVYFSSGEPATTDQRPITAPDDYIVLTFYPGKQNLHALQTAAGDEYSIEY